MKKPTLKKSKQSKVAKATKASKSTRITNETVAAHRERIIADGRRFKYPVQYTKRRLVWTATGIGAALVVLFVGVSWWQLYKAQTTDNFYYRITRSVPLPVAKIDDVSVKYGDYLMYYKMSEKYLNTAEKSNASGSDDLKGMFDYYRAQSMQNAVVSAYAQKLAQEEGLSVSDDQVDAAIELLVKTSSDQTTISQGVIDRSLEQFYGLSSSDARYIYKQSLLRQTVAYAIDDDARKVSDEIKQTLDKDSKTEFAKIVEKYKDASVDVQASTSGWVSKSNEDGGLAAAAHKLEKGEVSGPIKPLSGDGYYFVRLIDTNKQQEVNYQFIKVGLGEFDKRIQALDDQNKITYYIDVPQSATNSQVKP